MLVGRGEERAEIDALLDDARRGRSGALVLTGEAGIGKSALLEYAREKASGMRTLSVTGVESESDLPFGALHALLFPVLVYIAGLPEPQRAALSAALALDSSAEPDRLATSAGTLTLLDDVASEQPLLLLLDDAHWLDRESAEAIAFVARRMAGIDLALLTAVRVGEPSGFDFTLLPTRAIQPLSVTESIELLELRHGKAIDGRAAQTLARIGAGNPLALIELPRVLSPEQLAGRESLEEPLPVAARIGKAFLRRLERLPADTQLSLLVAAAGADLSLAAIRDAAAALGGAVLEPAESEGLVQIEQNRIRFAHPLLRSAVYHSADPSLRRRVHRALAAALGDEPDQSAWQLAAGADGPDEEVAAALEAAAESAAVRGGHAAQARALERAAELSVDDDARARRLHASCRAAYWAGDEAAAIRAAERALDVGRDPLVRADLHHQLAVIADFDPRYRTRAPSSERLAEEAAQLQAIDPERAVALLGVVLQRHRMRLDVQDAQRLALKRLALAERIGGERRLRAMQDVAWTHTFMGEIDAATVIQDQVLDERRASGRLEAYASQAAETLLWLERFDDLRQLLSRSIDQGRATGNVLRVSFDLTNLALLELRCGHFASSRRAASEAFVLAEQMDHRYLEACNLATLAMLLAHLGGTVESSDAASRAIALAEELGDELIRTDAEASRGVLALILGEFERAAASLEPGIALTRLKGIAEPSVVPYAADLVEAYVRGGRVDDGVTLLEAFEQQAEAVGRRWALAAAARCRGLLAEPAEIDAVFGLALERHEEVPSRFERARTELTYGERLRRTNRRRDARPHLRAALEVFDELGARPWHDRAAAELRATGERVLQRDPDREQLTPQELQIATLVAEGLTNREIGAQIFLSPKTVEYHLTRVYRKLNLHSRAELIKEFAPANRQFEPTRS